MVKKPPAMSSMPTKARKRPHIGEARPSRVSEAWEKEAEVVGEEESWGKRMCEGIAQLSGSLDGLTTMVEIGRASCRERVWR